MMQVNKGQQKKYEIIINIEKLSLYLTDFRL